MTSRATVEPSEPGTILVAAAASGAGHVVHNAAEFSLLVLLGPETLVPLALTVVVAWAMLRRPGRVTFLAASAWTVVVVVVGGASGLPLAVWPFSPAQSVSHSVAHLAYAVAQLPLLWVAGRAFLGDR